MTTRGHQAQVGPAAVFREQAPHVGFGVATGVLTLEGFLQWQVGRRGGTGEVGAPVAIDGDRVEFVRPVATNKR